VRYEQTCPECSSLAFSSHAHVNRCAHARRNKILIPWPDAEYRQAIADMNYEHNHSWDYMVTMLMYILVQFVALLGHVYLATLCLRVYHKDVAPASA